jgi:hypothetical protein
VRLSRAAFVVYNLAALSCFVVGVTCALMGLSDAALVFFGIFALLIWTVPKEKEQ